jgi:hypothetical protein
MRVCSAGILPAVLRASSPSARRAQRPTDSRRDGGATFTYHRQRENFRYTRSGGVVAECVPNLLPNWAECQMLWQ